MTLFLPSLFCSAMESNNETNRPCESVASGDSFSASASALRNELTTIFTGAIARANTSVVCTTAMILREQLDMIVWMGRGRS